MLSRDLFIEELLFELISDRFFSREDNELLFDFMYKTFPQDLILEECNDWELELPEIICGIGYTQIMKQIRKEFQNVDSDSRLHLNAFSFRFEAELDDGPEEINKYFVDYVENLNKKFEYFMNSRN